MFVSLGLLSTAFGGVVAAAVGGGIGTLLGLLYVNTRERRRAESESDDGASLASQVPVARMMVAVTDQRMLFFHMNPFANSPKQLLVGFELPDAPELSLPDGEKFVGTMTFAFSDSSVATAEVVNAGSLNSSLTPPRTARTLESGAAARHLGLLLGLLDVG